MKDKELGKIESAKFGLIGNAFGLFLSFSGKGWGVSTSDCFSISEHEDYFSWTEDDRAKAYGNIMRRTGELLQNAQKSDVKDLVGTPVECEFDRSVLKNWRVLEEVL